MKVIVVCLVAIALIGLPVQGKVVKHEKKVESEHEESVESKHEERGESEHSVGERVKHLMKKRCSKNGDDEDYRKFEEKLDELKPCIAKLMPEDMNEDGAKVEENCYEHRNEVLHCFSEFVDSLRPCLDRRENYLPRFLIKGFEEYTSFFCNHSRMLTLTELLETNMAKCINRFIRNEDIRPSHVCYETGKLSRSNHPTHHYVTKAELCRDLDNVYNCYEMVFKEECPDSPKAWEFEGGLLRSVKAGC